MSETFPMDSQGAVQSDGTVIYISSNEEDAMDCLSVSSVLDVLSSSNEGSEEIAKMPRCPERQLADPILIPVPSEKDGERMETPRLTLPLYLTFNQS